MHSLPREFLVLCRQLGEAQQRCSTALSAQAAEIQALQGEIVRLRGALVVRDTRLAMAREELAQLEAVSPGLPRRRAMGRHIGALAERIAALSRECLRWRLAAEAKVQTRVMEQGAAALQFADSSGLQADAALDASLAAADLVICQTGCISHDEYWRVQDHCRRTGKPCILVDQPLAVRQAQALAAIQPMVVLRMASLAAQQQQQQPAKEMLAQAILSTEGLNENGT
ncbi:DUF2325 domain-containing protein [Acidovorax sp.]|uniref:DUF2325 domain-containing protein n=1 Tax=Acidovorax sp. TaxID=1872122 RepID=UPI00262FCF4A|nr:DUF2325 domain-containing protein [Acidovorax sp.]